MKKDKKVVVTHNGVFHADEVTAIAILKVFGGEDLEVIRVPHQKKIPEIVREFNPDYVIDIGGVYDGDRFFDHHQFDPQEVSLASAGLALKYLVEVRGIEVSDDVADLVSFVDANDLGLGESGGSKWTFIQAIRMFNADDIYSEEQEIAFQKAVQFMVDMLDSLKRAAEKERKAAEIAASAKKVMPGVLELPDYSPFWNRFINGAATPEAEVVVWFDKSQEKWKAQTVPTVPGSFEPNGRQIHPVEPLPDGMEFVHKGKFFAVASSREALLKYLEENLK